MATETFSDDFYVSFIPIFFLSAALYACKGRLKFFAVIVIIV